MNRTAFTLVELMASLAISTLLLVTVMGLTARLSTSAKMIHEKHPVESWKEVLQTRLERDYQNARSVVVRRLEIIIDGTGLRSSNATEDGFLLPVPTRVIWSIGSDDNVSLLVRKTEMFGFPSPDNRTTEFLGSGIVAFGTDQPLATDVAPGILGLEIYELNSDKPLKFNLVRHGMLE